MISDFLIDNFNAIMNTLILILIAFLIYMFTEHDMYHSWIAFKIFVRDISNFSIQEIIDAVSKTRI